MLNPNNPGLTHIRELYLRLEKLHVQERERYDQSDASSDEAEHGDDVKLTARQAHFTVRLLLDFLPRDTLETFRWQSWEPLSVDNFVLLCRNQRRLRVLQIDPTDGPLDPTLEKQPSVLEGLTGLETVDVYPDAVDRLKAANRLLRIRPGVKQLSVSVAYELSNEVPEELHDSSTRPGVLSRTLFSHMLPFETCEPFNLTGLELCDVFLRYCADTWIKVVRFPGLQRLEIQNCEGADVLFAQLSKEHQLPKALRTLRWYDQNKCENHAVGALSGFMETLSGLKTIDIYLESMSALPRVDGILKHKESLTSLSVHSQSTEQNNGDLHFYPDADFGRICTECTNVRQLSLMFPTTPVGTAYPTSDFRSFLVSPVQLFPVLSLVSPPPSLPIYCGTGAEHKGLNALTIQRHTQKLPNLTVLNIRRWPTNGSSGVFSGDYARIAQSLTLYEHQLQRLTQRIFVKSDERARSAGHVQGPTQRSRLSVVAWGPNGRSRVDPSDTFRLKQVPFVRGKKVDPFGKAELLAMQVPWKMVQFVEPESDILNHSVGLPNWPFGIFNNETS